MLKTTVGGLPLESCVYNASGPRTGAVEALSKIGASASGAILSKSCTKVKQDGNPLPRSISGIPMAKDMCVGSFNSEGLPNLGIEYYTSQDTIQSLSSFTKPYILSISGLSLEDNIEMLGTGLRTAGVAAIEINLACPNIPGKPIIAYDFEEMDRVLTQLTSVENFSCKPVGVKLAPYFDVPHFERAASILAKYPIRFVTTINTIGNALFVDWENECSLIVPKNGLGGLGGGFVKQTALANVRLLYLKLQELNRGDIDVVGVGGVSSGRDAFELILCGAKAVQVGTCFWTEGPCCFGRINEELRAIMEKKGYNSLEDFRGKLKPFIKRPAGSKKKSEENEKAEEEGEGRAKRSGNEVPFFLYAVIAALAAVVIYLMLRIYKIEGYNSRTSE